MLAAAVAILAGLGAPGPPEALWQIGRTGDGFADLALAGDYRTYPVRFPRGIAYTVGTSAPDRDWPFIHPGPDDAWAGRGTHPFRIRFVVERVPRWPCRLVVETADTHSSQPPLLAITLNGTELARRRLPAGAGDASLVDPVRGRRSTVAVPFAASRLRAGVNEIALVVLAGSWLLYDALRLETDPAIPPRPDLAGLRAESTLLFRREGGRLLQAVRLSVENRGLEGSAEAWVSGAGGERRRVQLPSGSSELHLLIEPLRRRTPLRAGVRCGAGEWTTQFEGRPERRWTVFAAPSSHTDIGYTDLQERTFLRHCENTLRALRAAARDPAFKWNLEVAWQAALLEQRFPEEMPGLVRRAREGRIGVQGLYLNMLTGLCSGEELIEALARAQWLGRRHGFRVESANLSDVPTSAGTLPMLLSGNGVRYFAEAVNSQRGPLFAGAPASFKQSPFWWEALDGSRVLAIFTEQYAQAGTLGLTQSAEELGRRLPGWLRQFDRPDYPGDAVYVYGAFSDNVAMSPNYSRVAAEWNRRWAYPRVVVGRVDEFFRYVERTAGRGLPVLRGDFGAYWEDGAGSSARETALVRRARTRLEAAERWLALSSLGGTPFPTKALRDAWENILFYDEHTWGAWCSVSQPESEQTRMQWQYKRAYAERAAEQADRLYEAALAGLASPPRDPARARWVLVPNEQSWPRDLVVRVAVPPGSGPLRIQSPAGAPSVPVQRAGEELLFLARSVPALAVRAFRIVPGPAPRSPGLIAATEDPWCFRLPRHLLRVDPRTGAVTSLRDRRTGREWVDSTSGFGLNQFLYVLGGKGSSLVIQNAPAPRVRTFTPGSARVELVENGPVRGVLRITTEMEGGPRVASWISVGVDGGLQFSNVVRKPETLELESGWFAFPFRMDSPASARAFVELPYGVVEAEREQLPGACRDWHCVNGFAAVTDGSATALLASPDAPLVSIGDIFRGKWLKRLEGRRSALFSYAFNNYWDTNYRAAQGGDLLFSYCVRLKEGGFDPVAATRFGAESLAAMGDPWDPATVLRHGTTEGRVADSPGVPSPLLRVAGPALAGRITRRGPDLLVRLYNPSAVPARAAVALPGCRVRGAACADLAGFPQANGALPVRGNVVRVAVRPRGLATVLLRAHSGSRAARASAGIARRGSRR